MSLARRRSLVVALLFCPLVLAGPLPAEAQDQEPVFRLNATISQSPPITQRFGSVPVMLNVSVTVANPNALADEFEIVVTINRTQPRPEPNGWAISALSPGDSFRMRPGETRTVNLTVSLTLDRPDAETVRLVFEIHSRPEFQGSTTNPLLQPLITAGEQEDDVRSETTVRRALEAAEAVTSFVFQYRWILLLAAAGAIAGIALLVRKRGKSGIHVVTDQGVQEVVPGRGASFPLTITNLGSQRESVAVAASDVPAGWSAILPVDRLELRGSETTTIWLTLKAPLSAKPGESVQVGFIGTTSDGSTYEALLEANVVGQYGDIPAEEAPAAPSAGRGRPRSR